MKLEGSFSTPGFGESECKDNFFGQSHSLHYVIEFPKDLGDAVGDGDLVISVETADEWSFSWNRTMQLHKKKLNMSDAEDFCISQGKHLASITTEEEEKEMEKLTTSGRFKTTVWLGGKWNEVQQFWQWLDGRNWEFGEKWDGVRGSEENGCLTFQRKMKGFASLEYLSLIHI